MEQKLFFVLSFLSRIDASPWIRSITDPYLHTVYNPRPAGVDQLFISCNSRSFIIRLSCLILTSSPLVALSPLSPEGSIIHPPSPQFWNKWPESGGSREMARCTLCRPLTVNHLASHWPAGPGRAGPGGRDLCHACGRAHCPAAAWITL